MPFRIPSTPFEELATGDFIRRYNNLIMVGWSGIGKSHIIQALGQKICVQGYRVVYRTSAEIPAQIRPSPGALVQAARSKDTKTGFPNLSW